MPFEMINIDRMSQNLKTLAKFPLKANLFVKYNFGKSNDTC